MLLFRVYVKCIPFLLLFYAIKGYVSFLFFYCIDKKKCYNIELYLTLFVPMKYISRLLLAVLLFSMAMVGISFQNQDVKAQTAFEKNVTVENISRSGGAITQNVPARPGDQLRYVFTTTNPSISSVTADIVFNVADLLPYMDVIASDQAHVNMQNGTLSWGNVYFGSRESISKSITFQVKQTYRWPSFNPNVRSNDLFMQVEYGNRAEVYVSDLETVNIDVFVESLNDRNKKAGENSRGGTLILENQQDVKFTIRVSGTGQNTAFAVPVNAVIESVLGTEMLANIRNVQFFVRDRGVIQGNVRNNGFDALFFEIRGRESLDLTFEATPPSGTQTNAKTVRLTSKAWKMYGNSEVVMDSVDVQVGGVTIVPPTTTQFPSPVTLTSAISNISRNVTTNATTRVSGYAGDIIEYALTVRNISNVVLSNVDVSVVLDEGLKFVSNLSPTSNTLPDSRTVSWKISSMPVDGTSIIRFRAVVLDTVSAPREVRMVTTANSQRADNVASQQTQSFVFVDVTNSDVYVRKLYNPAQLDRGEVAGYTVVVQNPRNEKRTNVVVKDVLPPELTFVEATRNGKYDISSRMVIWTLETLDPNQTIYLTVTGRYMGGSISVNNNSSQWNTNVNARPINQNMNVGTVQPTSPVFPQNTNTNTSIPVSGGSVSGSVKPPKNLVKTGNDVIIVALLALMVGGIYQYRRKSNQV